MEPGDRYRELGELCLIYPDYNAVYLRLNSWQQTLFVFVLPLLKLSCRKTCWRGPPSTLWSSCHWQEVEVFNALYVAKCMQSVDLITTFVTIMGLDV